MPDFVDQYQLHDFLVRRPPIFAAAFATRAALRSVPSLIKHFIEETKEKRTDAEIARAQILPVLRAVMVPWVAAAFPEHHSNLVSALYSARHGADTAGGVVAMSASAAITVQFAIGDGRATSNVTDVVNTAIQGANVAATALSRITANRDSASYVIKRAAALDIEELADGLNPVAVMSRPLWRTGMHSWTEKSWEMLRARLLVLNKDWKVWIDWYDARLKGSNANVSIEVARALIPDEVWKAGPRAVNTHLSHLEDEGEVQTPPVDPSNWAAHLSKMDQGPLGARFVRLGNSLVIDPSGVDSDQLIADENLTQQLHDGIIPRARDFAVMAGRVSNKPGWTGLAPGAERFRKAVDCDTHDIPDHIGSVYDSLVALGSYLELDRRVRNDPQSSSIDQLDAEVAQALSDLVRSAAPWVRRFPTARTLDDEAGAFLSKADLYEPAFSVIERAEATKILSREDAQFIKALIEAARRGDFQGSKAGVRGIWSSKNLAATLALLLSFEVGMIGNEAAGSSLIARRGAQFYLLAERELLELFADAPADIRHALLAMVDHLRKEGGSLPWDIPKRTEKEPIALEDKPRGKRLS